MSVYPVGLQIVDDELEMEWSDAMVRRYKFQELRDGCPCATCREQRQAQAEKPVNPLQLNVLSPTEAQPLKVTGMKPVGNYAYTIVFSDGHDSGIFTFELLRELGRIQS